MLVKGPIQQQREPVAATVTGCSRFDAVRAVFDESKHPRGQPQNKGEFGPGGGGGSASAKPVATPEGIARVKEKFPELFEAAGGKPKSSQKGGTKPKSKNFDRWFKDSKVVDKSGKPLVLYHGTISPGFDAFKGGSHFGTEKAARNRLSNMEAEADNASDDEEGDALRRAVKNRKDSIYKVYLSIKNPKRVRDVMDPQAWDTVIRQAKKEGHDGLVYENEIEGDESWVVFEPGQVKSVNNSGEFDRNDKRIHASNEVERLYQIKAVRAEQLARRIEAVTAAEDTHCSAKAVVMNQLGQVLVLKDAGGDWHDLPGGRIHEGEDAITGLAREVREETGLSIGDIKLGETINFKAGKVPHTTLLFKATALTLDVRLSSEHSDYTWVEPSNLSDYALGLLLAPMQRLLKPITIQAQDATFDNHHEKARVVAEGIYKAEIDGWLSELNFKTVSGIKRRDDLDEIIAGLAAMGVAWFVAMTLAAKKARKTTARTLSAHQGFANTPEEDALEAFALSRKQPLEAFPVAVREKVAASLKRGLAGGESSKALARRVNEVFNDISEGAAQRVAATEAQVTYGASQAEALALAGYRSKRWVTMGDDRVRDSHLLCEEQGAVPASSPFQNGLMFPGDPNGSPEEVINCRCNLEGVE